ncbi:MAG: nickel-responsive transcriptional regulator NikR [Bacillota bacterium]|jgi:CopG family nickel-responsive transcriptional regulator
MGKKIIRFGVSMEADLLERFDGQIGRKGYGSRSEAIRDLVRKSLIHEGWEAGEQEVAGTITLLYDHHVRGLSELLTRLQHDFTGSFVSTMHVHMDHHNCLEVIVVKAKAKEARALADLLIAQKGVKHGNLTVASSRDVL